MRRSVNFSQYENLLSHYKIWCMLRNSKENLVSIIQKLRVKQITTAQFTEIHFNRK